MACKVHLFLIQYMKPNWSVFGYTLNAQKTPHSTPSQVTYGVSIVSTLYNNDKKSINDIGFIMMHGLNGNSQKISGAPFTNMD